MNHRDLEKFSKVCRKYGIKRLDLDGVKVSIEYHDTYIPPTSPGPKEQVSDIVDDSLSPEEILLWSSTSHVPDGQ